MSARPHIETHSRSRGHSSVAGCAYRLGIALFDHRTGTLHDYRRKNGVVAWHHLAPASAQGWQCDPEMFWNKAEAAERRSDSHVARCYRVPVPLGFDEESAVAMALEIAERLRDIIEAPVSLGVHQDSDVDGLGNAKPPEKIGYHAHIYLPTRGVASDGMAGKKEGIFLDLGNRAHSGQIIERFNRLWADVANRHAHRQNLAPLSDHRSLLRQGVDREPVPTLGVCASALERRGVSTAAGDALRFSRLLPPLPRGDREAESKVAAPQVVQSVQSVQVMKSIQELDADFAAEMLVRIDHHAAKWRFLDRQVIALRIWVADKRGEEAARLATERAAWLVYRSCEAKERGWRLAHPQPPLWRFWQRPAWRSETGRRNGSLSQVRREHEEAAARASPKAINELRAALLARESELALLLAQRQQLASMPSEIREAHSARRTRRRLLAKMEGHARPEAVPVAKIGAGPSRRMR